MGTSRLRKIVVDGDACPVKQEIISVARRFGLPVLMVSSYDHVLRAEEGVTVVQVDRGQTVPTSISPIIFLPEMSSLRRIMGWRRWHWANVAGHFRTGARNMRIPPWILCWRAGMPRRLNADAVTIPRVPKRLPPRKKSFST